MDKALRTTLEALGADIAPPMIQGTQQHFARAFAEMDPATIVTRDAAYGPDERNRLDIFTTAGRKDAPVLVFVHGGGFVMGDKRMTDTPFYDNVGDFAVRSGYVGVTLTYRLAPAHPWPAGPEDMAQAVAWLRAHIVEHGGDPARIYLMGQSAGGTHVASYVAFPRFHAADGTGLAGALLISAVYDAATMPPSPLHAAYYGEDHSRYADFATIDGLVASDLPLLYSVSEFDPVDFRRQAARLAAGYDKAGRDFPRLHWLGGHNHLSPVLAIGSPGETLGPHIRAFIEATAG